MYRVEVVQSHAWWLWNSGRRLMNSTGFDRLDAVMAI